MPWQQCLQFTTETPALQQVDIQGFQIGIESNWKLPLENTDQLMHPDGQRGKASEKVNLQMTAEQTVRRGAPERNNHLHLSEVSQTPIQIRVISKKFRDASCKPSFKTDMDPCITIKTQLFSIPSSCWTHPPPKTRYQGRQRWMCNYSKW